MYDNMFSRTLILATALLGAAWASSPSAFVTIEASHGGAGQDLTNITLRIPFTTTYSNHSALDAVSTLYLVGATNGTPIDSITCTPFKNADGTGDSGKAFDSTKPSFLSTNTVQVGSIVCITTDISFAPPQSVPGGSLSVAPSMTKTKTKTRTKSHHNTHMHSTKVSTTHITGTAQTTATQASAATGGLLASSSTAASSSSPAAQTTGNAASSLSLPGEFFGGLALVGFGLAFAL